MGRPMRNEEAMMIDTRTTVVAACGVSAGVHSALFATHVATLPGFAAAYLGATLLLVVAGLAVALRPGSRAPAAAALLLAGLLVAYVVWRHEPFGVAAGLAKGVEAVGLVGALVVLRRDAALGEPAAAFAVLAVCLAAGLMLGGGHAHA